MLTNAINKMTFAQALREEYRARIAANPSYSLRGFARDLKLDPSHLRRVLGGSRPPTLRMVEHVGETLKWDKAVVSEYLAGEEISRVTRGRKMACDVNPRQKVEIHLDGRNSDEAKARLEELQNNLQEFLSREGAQRPFKCTVVLMPVSAIE